MLEVLFPFVAILFLLFSLIVPVILLDDRLRGAPWTPGRRVLTCLSAVAGLVFALSMDSCYLLER